MSLLPLKFGTLPPVPSQQHYCRQRQTYMVPQAGRQQQCLPAKLCPVPRMLVLIFRDWPTKSGTVLAKLGRMVTLIKVNNKTHIDFFGSGSEPECYSSSKQKVKEKSTIAQLNSKNLEATQNKNQREKNWNWTGTS